MTEFVIQEVGPEVIAPFARLAARDHIGLRLDGVMQMTWIAALTARSGVVAGFGGIGRLSPGRWRLRTLWVVPDQRGQGISNLINDRRIWWLIAHAAPDDVVDGWHNPGLDAEYWTSRGLPPTGAVNASGSRRVMGLVRDLTPPVDKASEFPQW